MNRRSLLVAGATGATSLVYPAVALARRRGDGFQTIPFIPFDAVPYFKPGRDLTGHANYLDTQIRDAVLHINRSGWVWTAQSCQGGRGHPYQWPNIRLVCREDDAGAMLALLTGAFRKRSSTSGTHTTCAINPVAAPAGWWDAYVGLGHYGGTRQMGLGIFEKFAEEVNRG